MLMLLLKLERVLNIICTYDNNNMIFIHSFLQVKSHILKEICFRYVEWFVVMVFAFIFKQQNLSVCIMNSFSNILSIKLATFNINSRRKWCGRFMFMINCTLQTALKLNIREHLYFILMKKSLDEKIFMLK